MPASASTAIFGFPQCCCLLGVILFALQSTAAAQEQAAESYPVSVERYLRRIYAPEHRTLRYRHDYPGGFTQWQRDARSDLRDKLGLQRIADTAQDHVVTVQLQDPLDVGTHLQQRGVIETEPDVPVPFWLLTPKTPGPWPVAVLPHGHDSRGHDTTAGVYADEAHRERSLAGDRDVGVQAVTRGFLTVAPAVRGLSIDGVPDLQDRHGARPCRSHVMHCFLAGRTAMGERVWDMQRILDWVLRLSNTNPQHVLMMGNSGGGMVTLFTAACDERITVAVPSCSFAPTVRSDGYIFHCDCNMVPGLIELGGLPGVAGLTAPRHLLAVSGRTDRLFTNEAIDDAARQVQLMFEAAKVPRNFQHQWGHAGHRFYSDLMWPFIAEATAAGTSE